MVSLSGPVRKFIGKILVVLAILLVIASLATFLSLNKVASSKSLIYDQQFAQALKRISGFVPPDEVIVVSTNAPFVKYFTRRAARIPFGSSSEESLVDYMSGHKYTYLLVFEGSSQIPELQPLFSSSGLKALKNNFNELTYINTDFVKMHLYALSTPITGAPAPASWNIYAINSIDDTGTPLLSEISTIQIRITDKGNEPVNVWLGKLALIDDENQKETALATFESGHGFMKQSASGEQEDDTSCSFNGSQSLKLTTNGDGKPVFTRKTDSLNIIDFSGKSVELRARIENPGQLREFRITISSDNYENYRNYWIIR